MAVKSELQVGLIDYSAYSLIKSNSSYDCLASASEIAHIHQQHREKDAELQGSDAELNSSRLQRELKV